MDPCSPCSSCIPCFFPPFLPQREPLHPSILLNVTFFFSSARFCILLWKRGLGVARVMLRLLVIQVMFVAAFALGSPRLLGAQECLAPNTPHRKGPASAPAQGGSEDWATSANFALSLSLMEATISVFQRAADPAAVLWGDEQRPWNWYGFPLSECTGALMLPLYLYEILLLPLVLWPCSPALRVRTWKK